MSDNKIILASGSRARQEMLRNADIFFDIKPADLDEETILQRMQGEGASPKNMALNLAQEKAVRISLDHPNQYIIGSDQILSMNNAIYSKAKNVQEARDRLFEFQGQDHFLTSAVCVVQDGKILWSAVDGATLKMKSLDDQAIDAYIEKAGDALTSCVGCYALESVGIRLFKEIEGNYFTILGMPLLPLLNFLDEAGAL